MSPIDPIKAMYGSEKEYRAALAHPSDLMGRIKDLERDLNAIQSRRQREARETEFAYPPWVQEALDFIERETAAYERRERQAACRHENIKRVEDTAYDDPRPHFETWCTDCGLTLDDDS
jgi:hypothetical protein